MTFVSNCLVTVTSTRSKQSLLPTKSTCSQSRRRREQHTRCLLRKSSEPVYKVIEDDADISVVPVDVSQENEERDALFIEDCPTCGNTGFVPCSTCNAEGFVRNPSYCADRDLASQHLSCYPAIGMQTVGDERVRAADSLRQLEEAAQLLEEASKQQKPDNISSGFPSRVSGILNELTTISSRDDAERLLSLGVAMWNSAIAFETHSIEQSTAEALVKVRHVAADCMYMSTTVLGGISARYNIDELSLLKFYTACGQRYAADLGDTEMAEVCFAKAMEFAQAAIADKHGTAFDRADYAKAMFDLMLGRAECAWENGDSSEAENFVGEARKFLEVLPGEYEFLASVEYNFGLFTYQAKDTARALKWLERSMETRGSTANRSMNASKQARTLRLAGVCRLALQEYEESWKMMKKAEDICHDPVGSYLLLKLSVITKRAEAFDLLLETIQETDSSLDVCIACISLFTDAQRVSEAASGYEKLFHRFHDDPKAIVCSIGPRFFETLSALGRMQKAIDVLNVCTSAIDKLNEAVINSERHGNIEDREPETAEAGRDLQLSRWSALLLAAGSALADRKDFAGAAELLDRALALSRKSRESVPRNNDTSHNNNVRDPLINVVVENEAAVCRLAASCALCSIDNVSSPVGMAVTDVDSAEGDKTDLREEDLKALAMARRHAQRAKELESNDFTPRLLLFRIHLVSRDFRSAAAELHSASADMRSFDPGAVAEAACAARDVGSTESVVAALRCILKLDPQVMSASLESSGSMPPKGFFGTVLLSCINLLLKKNEDRRQDPGNSEPTSTVSASSQNRDMLLDTLKLGKRGLEYVGLDSAFEDTEKAQQGLTYLVDVAWNGGRECGIALVYSKWDSFFSLCYDFSTLLSTDISTLQTRRMSKLMCACSKIENPESTEESFIRGVTDVKDARQISIMMQELSPTPGGDPIDGLLFILEARCCVGCQNIDALAVVVEAALLHGEVTAGALEQLAAICYNFPKVGDNVEGQRRARCADMTTSLLSKAADIRLCQGKQDVEALAITIREHLGIELSRSANAARSFTVFEKAVGIVLEFSDKFPNDERRWLVAIGWDRAQMHKRLGQNSEAKRWCERVIEMTEGFVALSTYRPRLLSFLESLRTD